MIVTIVMTAILGVILAVGFVGCVMAEKPDERFSAATMVAISAGLIGSFIGTVIRVAASVEAERTTWAILSAMLVILVVAYLLGWLED